MEQMPVYGVVIHGKGLFMEAVIPGFVGPGSIYVEWKAEFPQKTGYVSHKFPGPAYPLFKLLRKPRRHPLPTQNRLECIGTNREPGAEKFRKKGRAIVPMEGI
jgi:hypothetical protein